MGRWLQFRLRSLLAVMLAACCGLGWVAYLRGQAAEQQAAYDLIIAKRGLLTNFGRESARGPWLRTILGKDVAARGGCVEFDRSGLTDADLARLSSLRGLQRLSLSQNPLTDQGVTHLSKLRQLRYLSLEETNVSDAGLESLHACQSLEYLSLYRTRTTTAGVQRLRTACPHANIIDADDKDWPPLNVKK
jgi:hypothetical protein